MSAGKAKFESSNPTHSMAGIDEVCVDGYSRLERRKGNRRTNTDRRQGVRYDLTSTDRRQNPGRRSSDRCHVCS